MLVRVVEVGKTVKLLDLSLTPDVLRVTAAPGDFTTQAVAAASGPSFLLVLLSGSLLGRSLGTNGAQNGNSTVTFDVEDCPPLGREIENGNSRGRPALITCAKPSAWASSSSGSSPSPTGTCTMTLVNALYSDGGEKNEAPSLKMWRSLTAAEVQNRRYQKGWTMLPRKCARS